MPRHLPPTAVPLTFSDLQRGLTAFGGDGSINDRFRKALSRYLGVDHCYLASSARAALCLLLCALRESTGAAHRREVLLPAYTCPSLVKAVLRAELTPRLADISPDTLDFEPDALARSINQETLAVVCVHPFGIPQPIERVSEIARAAGAFLIEDAAQAMGARQANRMVGTRADFGLFSLGPGKPLSTAGGGIVCTERDEYAHLIKQASASLPRPSVTVSSRALLRLITAALAYHPGAWWLISRVRLNPVSDSSSGSEPFAVRSLTAVQAAVGLTLLNRLESINKRRRENACRLIEGVRDAAAVDIPSPPEGSEPIYLRLPVLITDPRRRERLFRELYSAGMGVGKMYRRTLADVYPNTFEGTRYPGADYVARHLLTLPTHHHLTATDIDRIGRVFHA